MEPRIPNFGGHCYHIKDQIIPLNGGRFNLDHYLRVLREKAQLDPTVLKPYIPPTREHND